eukprot:3299235-Prymnesium_polylepis.1
MLCMNERIACRVPCIVEGETGVSKTALTRMLFVLLNRRLVSQSVPQSGDLSAEMLQAATKEVLQNVEDSQGIELLAPSRESSGRASGRASGHASGEDIMSEVMDCISKKLPSSSSGVQAEGKLLQCVSGLLIAMLRSDPGLDAPPGVVESAQGGAYDDLIAWYIQTVQEEESAKQSAKQAGVDLKDGDVLLLDWTFQQLNVHAALTPSEIEAELRPTIQRGWRLTELARLLNSRKHADVKLCIFLDEVNTSQCMGVFKELVVDRRLNGEDLPDNIVVIAACNPARDRLSAKAADARRVELGKEWAMGHYQVHPLPLSIEQVVWNFGSLTETQESEFVSKRMVLLDDLPAHEHSALLGLICQSQILI